MENHTKIQPILKRYYQLKRLNVRENPNLSHAIIDGAKVMMRKPFYRSWSSSIVEVALQEELTFSAFRICILLIGPQTELGRFCWNGCGTFLSEANSDQGYSYCGDADLAFSILLDSEIYEALNPYLEDPKTASSQKKDKEAESVLEFQKIMNRISGKK